MNRILQAFIIAPLSLWAVAASANTNIGSFDSGGGISSSALYQASVSTGTIVGNSSGGSVSNTSGGGILIQPPAVVTNLTLTATPASVSEGSNSVLSGVATFNDQTVTVLTGASITWNSVTYPYQSLNTNGLLTAVDNVYGTATGTVYGSYLGVSGSANVQVLGPYAGSRIPDSWFLQYFGTPPNPLAAPTADADGTGQNNLLKYVAGLNPTSPSSIFLLQIANVAGQPGQKNLIFSPAVAGRTYTVMAATNLINSAYNALTGITGPQTNGSQITVTDLNATQTNKFYQVNISIP
jgi:hypothetical protein